MNAENLNEAQQWNVEAESVIKEIKGFVHQAFLSDELNNFCNFQLAAFINIETVENKKITVKLSSIGYTIVGQDFDTKDDDAESVFKTDSCHYETIYALLDSLSAGYTDRFAQSLSASLEKLKR